MIGVDGSAAMIDQARAAQIGQMPRRFRLGNAQALVDVADSHLPRQEESEDAKPRRVPECLKERGHRVKGRLHIRVDKYITRGLESSYA